MKFSVLLSVYERDCPLHLNLALRSIWHDQTLKPNQIVLVEDGRLGKLLEECIDGWKSSLQNILVVVKREKNSGLAVALNEGLNYCKYELVARMDADDISVPKRFEMQVNYMELNESIIASSAYIQEFCSDVSELGDVRRLPLSDNDIRKFSLSRSPLNHPVSIFRKDEILKVGGYPHFQKAQDYGLWTLLLAHGYSLGNIPEILLLMRIGTGVEARRGINQLASEFKLLNYQRNIGFISRKRYVLNLIVRVFARSAPVSIKKKIYKFLRAQ